MLSLLTHTAIALLRDVAIGRAPLQTLQVDLPADQFSELLAQLSVFIRPAATATGYELARPASQITLMDILCATNQHLNCNHPTNEAMYLRYRSAANRLGVINTMTRAYLMEIKLTDF